MKKSVAILLSGGMALAAMSLVSCEQELNPLTLEVPASVTGGGYEIHQGETLEIPFTVGSLEGFGVEVSAVTDNEDYIVTAALDESGAAGKVTLTAPEYILEDATVSITLTVLDAANSRQSDSKIEVKAVSVLETLAASNCHLTSPDSFIGFSAVKGNSAEALAVASAELLWEDAVGLVADVFTSADNNTIYVKVAEAKKGNAVVCAKDAEGAIVWSWHIWVSEEDATANTMEYTYTKDDVSTTYYMMDRNVGALTSELGTADVNGCFYQWGRKDPFPASDNKGGLKKIYDKDGQEVTISTALVTVADNVSTAIQNPITRYTTAYSDGQSWITNNNANLDAAKLAEIGDYWGFVSNKKSVYDPCPAGYRVAVTNAWRFYSDNTIAKKTVRDDAYKPVGYQVTLNENTYNFPGQGQIDGSNYEISGCLGNSYYSELNGYSYGKNWHSQFNADYFQAYATEVGPSYVDTSNPDQLAEDLKNPGSYATGYGYTTAYSFPVRCIKE